MFEFKQVKSGGSKKCAVWLEIASQIEGARLVSAHSKALPCITQNGDAIATVRSDGGVHVKFADGSVKDFTSLSASAAHGALKSDSENPKQNGLAFWSLLRADGYALNCLKARDEYRAASAADRKKGIAILKKVCVFPS